MRIAGLLVLCVLLNAIDSYIWPSSEWLLRSAFIGLILGIGICIGGAANNG